MPVLVSLSGGGEIAYQLSDAVHVHVEGTLGDK